MSAYVLSRELLKANVKNINSAYGLLRVFDLLVFSMVKERCPQVAIQLFFVIRYKYTQIFLFVVVLYKKNVSDVLFMDYSSIELHFIKVNTAIISYDEALNATEDNQLCHQ